jgi:hypothetical protein
MSEHSEHGSPPRSSEEEHWRASGLPTGGSQSASDVNVTSQSQPVPVRPSSSSTGTLSASSRQASATQGVVVHEQKRPGDSGFFHRLDDSTSTPQQLASHSYASASHAVPHSRAAHRPGVASTLPLHDGIHMGDGPTLGSSYNPDQPSQALEVARAHFADMRLGQGMPLGNEAFQPHITNSAGGMPASLPPQGPQHMSRMSSIHKSGNLGGDPFNFAPYSNDPVSGAPPKAPGMGTQRDDAMLVGSASSAGFIKGMDPGALGSKQMARAQMPAQMQLENPSDHRVFLQLLSQVNSQGKGGPNAPAMPLTAPMGAHAGPNAAVAAAVAATSAALAADVGPRSSMMVGKPDLPDAAPSWCVVTGLPQPTPPPSVPPDGVLDITHLLPWPPAVRAVLQTGQLSVTLDPTVLERRGGLPLPSVMFCVANLGEQGSVQRTLKGAPRLRARCAHFFLHPRLPSPPSHALCPCSTRLVQWTSLSGWIQQPSRPPPALCLRCCRPSHAVVQRCAALQGSHIETCTLDGLTSATGGACPSSGRQTLQSCRCSASTACAWCSHTVASIS